MSIYFFSSAMEFTKSQNQVVDPMSIWSNIGDWAKNHYRDRVFAKDESIPVRQGLLYLVNTGVVRLVGSSKVLSTPEKKGISFSEKKNLAIFAGSSEMTTSLEETKNSFLGFVGGGEPFEIVADTSLSIKAYAHEEDTRVTWLYWEDLDNWTNFRREIYEMLRYQHQRKLLWVSALGQRRTMDRLTSFLGLLIEEYGQPCHEGYFLPYTLTHAQISSSIGATRVTVTRLMGELKRQGYLKVLADNSICLPFAETA